MKRFLSTIFRLCANFFRPVLAGVVIATQVVSLFLAPSTSANQINLDALNTQSASNTASSDNPTPTPEPKAQSDTPDATQAAVLTLSDSLFRSDNITPEEFLQQSVAEDNTTRSALSSAHIRGPLTLRRLAKKTYRADEEISAVVENTSATEVQTTLLDARGKMVETTINVEAGAGENSAIVTIEPPETLQPGLYTLSVKDATGKTTEQDFTWGVLAINSDKSIYLPHETANFSLAVLDEMGKMVCDASVELRITETELGIHETLTTENGKIKVNDECNSHNFTLKPDYEAQYQVGDSGRYSLALSAKTKNGTFAISDSLLVKDSIPFDVRRVEATRIYPPTSYPVTLVVKANKDFSGTLVEMVPDEFAITPSIKDKSYDTAKTTVSTISKAEDVLGISTSSLAMPIKDAESKLSLGFGQKLLDPLLKKVYGEFGLAGHDGVDFAADIGTPVFATDDGVVKLAGGGDYGTTIAIEHFWGKSYYGHLSQLEVKTGEKVKKGQVIALSGNSGLSSGPHLHFGVKPNEPDINNGYYGKVSPLPYLGLSEPSGQVLAAVSERKVKVLTWNVTLKKGQTVTLGYTYKAPNISPQFYTTGPLQFVQKDGSVIFQEARSWQIAVDAVAVTLEQQVNITNQEYTTTSATSVPTDKSLGIVNYDSTKYNRETVYFESVSKKINGDKRRSTNGDGSAVYCLSSTDCKLIYLDTTNSSIRFRDCDNSACSTGSIVTLDGEDCVITGCNTTRNVANSTYFVIDLFCVATDDCKVVYQVYAEGSTSGLYDLYLVDCDSATCGSGTTTILMGTGCTLTGCSNDQFDTAVTIDCTGGSTDCKIAFKNQTDTALNFIDCDNATCSTGTVQLVDGFTSCPLTGCNASDLTATNAVDLDCSQGVTDCKILYDNSTKTAAYFADCDNATCSTGTVSLIDGYTGCSLTGCLSGDTIPSVYGMKLDCPSATDCKLVYYNGTKFGVYMVDCDNATCSSGTVSLIDGETGCTLTNCSSSIMAQYPAIDCVGGSTDCKISYHDAINTAVRFVDCDNATCTTGTIDLYVDGATGCDLSGCSTTLSSSNDLSMFCVSATDCKISYYGTSGTGGLYFADCDDATCASGTATRIDGDGWGAHNLGRQAAMDCPSATDCKIVYYDETDTSLRFTDCDDATCSTGTTIFLDGVDGCLASGCNSADAAGEYLSIVCLSSTDCKIAYDNDTKSALYFIDCDSTTCNKSTTQLVDGFTSCPLTGCNAADAVGNPTVGGAKSIDMYCLSATDCKIAYYNHTKSALYLADCDSATCSTGTVQLLDGFTSCPLTGCNAGDTIVYIFGTVDITCLASDDCKLVYKNDTKDALYFIDCDSATCGSGTVQLLDGETGCPFTGCSTTAQVGDLSAIDCVGGGTDCKIAYYNETDFALRFLDCDNATCSTGTLQILDGEAGCVLTGCVSSKLIYNETLDMDCVSAADCKIAYYNSTDTALYFADCDNATCSTGTAQLVEGYTSCPLTNCNEGDVVGNTSNYGMIRCLSASDCKILVYNFTKSEPYFIDCDSATCNSGTVTEVADIDNEYVWTALYDSSGNIVADAITMVKTNQTYTRSRSQALTLADGDYTVRTFSSDDADISSVMKAARLIIIQDDQTGADGILNTQTQVEMGANETTTSTTATSLTNPKYYVFDRSKFDGTTQAYFEASMKTTGGTGYAELYNRTDGAVVATASTTSTSWTRVRTSALSTNWDTSNADEYEVRIYATTGQTTSISNAKIIIEQASAGCNALAKVQTVQDYVIAVATDTDSTYTSQNFLNQFTPTNFASGTNAYYYEAILKTSAGTGYTQLYNATSASAITGSELSTASTSYTRARSSAITGNMPGSAKNLDSQLKNSVTNTTSVASSRLIVEISNMSAGGNAAPEDLMRHGKYFDCNLVLKPFTF